MRKTISFVCLVLLASIANAAPIISVYPSLGPSITSSSFAAYEANALLGLENGGIAQGTGPSAYSAQAGGPSNVATFPLAQATTSVGFNLWQGQVNPTGAFANENGNYLYFGLTISSPSQTFSISQLSFTGTGSPTSFFSDVSVPSLNATSAFVGQTTVGGPLITPTATTQLVTLYYVGVGVSFPVYNTDLGTINQTSFNNALTSFGYDPAATYKGVYGLASPVPLPGSLVLWTGSAGCALVFQLIRRRREIKSTVA